MTKLPPKGPPADIIKLGLQFQHVNWEPGAGGGGGVDRGTHSIGSNQTQKTEF